MSENGRFNGLSEPDWSMIFSDELEQQNARQSWLAATAGMRETGTLARENEPALLRLVSTYILYDRCMRQVAENGAVIAPRRKNSKAIARVSPHFTTMTKLAAESLALEAELGISPRARGKVSPARRKSNRLIGGGYLKIVK